MQKRTIAATIFALMTFALTAAGSETEPSAAPSGEDRAIAAIDQMVQKANVDKSKPRWRTSLPKPEIAPFDPNRKYFARMVTNKGSIRIQFMPDVAPMHVTSFIYLTQLGFHDGLTFHRVIPGFMAQGGCPLGSGTGGPGYEFDGEFSASVKHDQGGLLSMANRGPGTDGSQYFLTFVPTPWLDGKHTIFGRVVEGKGTLKALEAEGTRNGRPKEKLSIATVTIEVE